MLVHSASPSKAGAAQAGSGGTSCSFEGSAAGVDWGSVWHREHTSQIYNTLKLINDCDFKVDPGQALLSNGVKV